MSREWQGRVIANAEAALRLHGLRIPEEAILVECWYYDGQYILMGWPEEDDEQHNCDAMGCGTMSHVMLRFRPRTPEAELMLANAPDALCSGAACLETSAGIIEDAGRGGDAAASLIVRIREEAILLRALADGLDARPAKPTDSSSFQKESEPEFPILGVRPACWLHRMASRLWMFLAREEG